MASSARFLLTTTSLVMCVLSESFAVVPATTTAPFGVSSPKTGFGAISAAATTAALVATPARGTVGATGRWRPPSASSRVVRSSLHHSCDDHDEQASPSEPRTKTERVTAVSAEQHHHHHHQHQHQHAHQHQQQQQRRPRQTKKVSQQESLIDVSLTRQGMVGSAAAKMGFAGLLAATGLGLFESPTAARAAAAAAGDAERDLGEEYSSPDGSFALRYPSSFEGFSKPLKTHKVEVNFKSEEVRGYEVGVAVDPVRIESLETFGTPEEVGARVLKVEQGKDGTLETKLFDARAEKQGDLSLYTLDYFVESTRGFKHFVAKVTIKDNLLYACTAQAKEKDYPEVEEQLKRVVDSFRVPA